MNAAAVSRTALLLCAVAALAGCPEKEPDPPKLDPITIPKVVSATPVASVAPEVPKFALEARVKSEVDGRPADAAAAGSPIALPGATMTAPAGWTATKVAAWSTSTSVDQKARLASGPMAPADAAPAKANEAAAALTLTECTWGGPESVALGKDKLPATAADGICKRAGVDARAAYVALASGAIVVGTWDAVGGDANGVFSTLRSTAKAAGGGADSVAACCNALSQNMNSAPPEQKFAYAAAIAACNAVRSSPEGKAALGGVRAALAGANMPAACR